MADGRRTLLPLIALALVAAACGPRNGDGPDNPVSGWASVPACQTAIRARAFAEFGYRSRVAFQGIASEKRLSRGRIKVWGTAIIDREDDRLDVEYECVTQPRKNRLVSATYRAPSS